MRSSTGLVARCRVMVKREATLIVFGDGNVDVHYYCRKLRRESRGLWEYK